MRISQYFMPILRDDPKEAEIASHRLMLRSGMTCEKCDRLLRAARFVVAGLPGPSTKTPTQIRSNPIW